MLSSCCPRVPERRARFTQGTSVFADWSKRSLVRLAGPVRGRSAVCRDLNSDLWRISQVGACCIVCCLDDEELEFLGIR
ncbi:hypothetical protein EDB19DRAFT_1756957 [Suillus lakei]|nr:hypothetical protein EDB19DRAFT_1756957 [Suillus lakei]